MHCVTSSQWQQHVDAYLASTDNPTIVIVGPTASGKTSFSIRVAKHITKKTDKQCAVLNADSRQLYKELSIGTAKITQEEMQGIPHHLFDVLSPHEELTVGWYQKEAKALITSLHNSHSIPILVGGSMLYISSIIDELSMAPQTDPVLREQLEEEYAKDAGVTLHAFLTEVDPETAANVHPNNKPRLLRAIEIYKLTNIPKSQAIPSAELRQGNTQSHSDFCILGMYWDREVLKERINIRTKEMFKQGWLEEVSALLASGYAATDPAMKSTGYRDIVAYLERGDKDLASLQEHIAAQTRQYARRQMSWWKRDQRIQWVDASTF